jgi:myo-inositol-1(or 4)-monophosphatase
MREMAKIRDVAQGAAVEAGKYALKRIGDLGEISYKKGFTDLVTDVDKKCEEIIISRIGREFPDHSILAEESGEHSATGVFKWVIDPIDGTTNYTHAFPFFCTSIGVMFDGAVKVGVVYDPSRDELFIAEEKNGAFLNDKQIRVSRAEKVQDSLVATGFAYDIESKIANIDKFKRILENAQALRRAGSAALDLCYVACGRFDGFWEFQLNPWDTAAGQLIVAEAGGIVTLLNGEPFDIFQKEIVASNGKIHKEMLSLLNK